jgi:HlyD family secretion protein
MSKAQVTFVVLALLALTMVGALLGCRPQQAAPAKPAPPPAPKTPVATAAAAPVSVQSVRPVDFTERVAMTGTLQPVNSVNVGPRIAGRIAWVIGDEGTPVHRGDVLVRMDDMDARSQVRVAQAAVKAAQARLAQAKAAALQQLTATGSSILTAQAGVEAAVARVKQAKTTADATDATTHAQIKAAEATLDAATARLNALKNGARGQEKAIAENAVALAKVQYESDRDDYDRYKKLFADGAISKSVLDKTEAKMKIAKAQLDSAQQQASLVQTGARQEDIDAAQAAVRQAQEGVTLAKAGLKQVDVAKANVEIAETGVSQAKAALESAKASRQTNIMRDQDVMAASQAVMQAQDALKIAIQALDYTQVLAPVDGVVAARLADAGQAVGSNAAVLQISTNQSLYFEARVSELEATRLAPGQQAQVAVDALQSDRSNVYNDAGASAIMGTVDKVVPVVDARTRQFAVRVVVPRTRALFPGMFARASIITARHTGALTVPKDALIEREGKQYLFVAAGDTAHRRAVVLGAASDGLVEVKSGLAAGDQVVIVGQQTLLDGDKVSVVKK